ncbi:hypothetical protein CDD81_3135 [Ophiocordyceps australis]|uniref:Carrier domain-containing protein n=1 Tax=Ophiocordyceps australis TaxID=1399860 RepID=A0A2C5XWN1_9HYPO|nr:hypothetical protein CDD81_3135 [Ophiocordyceps australis]
MEVQNSMELLAFGDLTAKFDDELHELLHARESEALLSFFERVSFSLRHEVAQQPSDMQEWFPRFTTLLDLESKRGKALGAPVLQFCLMTACQVAKFIRYAEGRRFPSGQDTYLLGVCAGSFAACAISVSQTVHEVVLAGVEATRIAFRTALCSFVQGKTMTTGGNGPWSAVVARDGGVEKLVQDYCQDQHSHSRLSAPYISAVAPNNITVSGAPEVLDDFVTSNGLKHHWLGIESPFHARHVFDEEHVDWVMAQFPEVEVWLRKPMMAIFSGSRGKKMMAADFCGLLRWAVSDVLRQVVEWKDIIGTISASLSAQQAAVCTITPFFCNAAPLLLSQLAQESKGLKTMQSAGLPASQGAARPTGRFADSKIAIVGYSGRFPEAGSAEELWQVLEGGRDVHREIPEDRFKWQRYYSATGKQRNTSKVKHGCFIEEPGLFDTRFFNMSPREADNTDPAHRLALMATYEAMEMAGMVPNRTPSTQQERVGVFFGVTSDDWREANSSQDIDTYFIPGGVRAFMPGRISYFFRFSGPSLCIDTACSSSFAAVQAACGYLLRGECDTAVAGGTNILTNPDIFTGLDRGHFLAGTGNCKTFDDSASGYCRGEAVGAVILKRLEDAVADGDPIAGVIGGAHTNHCGQSESITRPHEGDQVAVFERVLRYGDVDGGEISYVEMHGTGTQAGDATEMGSVLRVFAGEGKRKQMLHVGSAKANVGHSESASGVVSLIKVLLMMKKSQIPPHCGITTRLNRSYPADLAQRKVAIAARTTEWRREDSAGEKRRAFINNFSAAGGNTALLLEDGPAEQQTDAQAARSVYTVAISAKSATALAANVAGLAAFVEARPDTPLDALAYTTTARRLHHSHRLAFSGDSTAAIAAQLRDAPAGLGPRGRAPRIAYLFSGQGALYTQLGRELYERVPRFRDDVVRFNRMAQQLGFAAFVPLIDGTASRLDDAPLCAHHLALLCVQMALSQLWASWRVRPSVVVGHSLGEYAALHAAGVVSASDAIFLVGRRATLLEQHCTRGSHAMLAVKAPAEAVRPLLAQTACEVACINQPAETVVGGGRQAIDEVARRARQLGHEAVVLAMPFAFHTSQVDAMLPDFEAAACSVHFEAPQVPLLSPLLARAVGREPVFDASYLARACRGTVHLSAALEHARACAMVDGDTLWLEMGSHALCSPMVKATLGPDTLALASLHKATPPERTMASALEALYVRGVDIDWDSHARAHGGPCQVLQLPAYHWDLSRHWIDYRNDFLLTKGRCESAALPSLSPSVQRVLEHKPAPDTATMLVESDIFDPRLAPVLQGHLVNGAALCPSSLYADIALTVAKAMVQDDNNNNNNNNNKPAGLDVCNIKIDRPLIAAKGHTSHLIRASATAHWASGFITMSIYSVDSDGKPTVSHASLKVGLVANAALWLDEWKPMAYLIHARIAALEAAVAHGNCHKMKRSMVYKLFGSIVDYSPEYQGMQHVILDSDELEATAQVSFRVGPEGFVMNPRWIDSLGHLAGFIMNGNEKLPSHKHVFVNHGWDRLRFGEEPVEGKLYTTYNKMQRVHASLYAGDTYWL